MSAVEVVDMNETESWGRATLKIFSSELDEREFDAAIASLGQPTGEILRKRTRSGSLLWRDRAALSTAAEAKELWAWAVAEVDRVLGVLGGPPPGCVAEVWLGLDVPLQRGLWCEAAQLSQLASRDVDLVLDLHA